MKTQQTEPTQAIALNAVMAYRNSGIVRRYQNKLGLSREEAETLFADTKRFLYLCATNDERLAPPKMVDEGWHHFILFTEEYADFCTRFFGRFIHHRPWTEAKTTDGQARMIEQTKEIVRAAFGNDLSRFWTFVAECTNCNCKT